MFDGWFAAASAKDIDATMAHIASDAVSYEHDAPLQHVGVDAIREVCQRGFDSQEGDLRWEIPDLRILVRGDVAVTWGLNRVRTQGPNGTTVEYYSRGTRIFQRIDGEWEMIHQHVSSPTPTTPTPARPGPTSNRRD